MQNNKGKTLTEKQKKITTRVKKCQFSILMMSKKREAILSDNVDPLYDFFMMAEIDRQ